MNMDTKNGRYGNLEDIESLFSEIVIQFIIIQEIIHVQKGFAAHGADVRRSHAFRWVIHIFFA